MRGRSVVVVVAASAFASACTDAVTLEIASDRPVPTAVDALCVGVADNDAGGGHFGAPYRLAGELAALPQTLRLEAGGADTAWAWVRADRGGVAVARAATRVDFGADVTLSLDRCVQGPAAAPAPIGEPAGPPSARLAVSQGQGGTLVIAVGADGAVILDASSGQLVARDAPALPAGAIISVVAADLDRDCDDDLIIGTAGAALALWRRDGATFVAAGTLGAATLPVVAAADVDHDGDLDLVSGGGGTLALWRNDGAGGFVPDDAALRSDGRATDVAALALGDIDGDGNADLIVGQHAQPLLAWLGDPDGTGSLRAADAVVPPVPLDIASLTLADADGDFDPDLAVAVVGAAPRLYIDRDGRLEDQTFVRLPQPAPIASALAFGGWDDGCEPDLVIASAAGSSALAGTPTGEYVADGSTPASTDVVLADVDDDGDLDAVFATTQGVVWLAR